MSADRFSWLHLTDFHYGLKGQGSLWPTLRQPFLDDLSRLHDLSGPWQALFFTGDLVQSGSPDQFAEMQAEVLDRAWRKLQELGSGEAALLAVPGNHDLCRPDPKVDNPAIDALLNLSGFDAIAEKFWDRPDGSYRKVVNDAFASYRNWWEEAPRRPKLNLSTGMLPGDFACTLACGEHLVGIIGLNTTFLQLQGGDYRGRLVWSDRQVHDVCGGAVDDWVKKHHVCLLLTHQGPDWLTPESNRLGTAEIAPAGRFVAHLYGHMHETQISYLKVGGGDALRRCQGSSVFGMEKYGDPPQTVRSHGYGSGRIEFTDENHANFRIWPRVATSKTGPWRFIPDHENAELLRDDGTSPEVVSIRSTKTKEPLRFTAERNYRSAFIAIPKSIWPTDIGIEMPDSMLLRPESRVVRFYRLREPLRDAIIGWALNSDERIKLRLQAGEGGSGKTRLLIEVSDQLERLHGWRAGFIDKAQSIASGFPTLLEEGKPSLVVVDYAESRTGEIVELVRSYLNAKKAPLVRIVLLAREGGDWWDRIAEAAGDDQAVAAILRRVNTKTGPYRMSQERIAPEDRLGVFQEALQDFANRKSMQIPVDFKPDLSSDYFGNPLFIQLSALAYVRGQPSVDDQELLSMALGHERSVWRRLLASVELPDHLLPALEQAVALLTLSKSGSSARGAKGLLARTPRLQELPAGTRTALFDLLRRIYPFEGGLAGVQPDLLGETLVGEALKQDDELLDAIFGQESHRDDRRYALTVLTRLARRVPSEGQWLKRTLERNLVGLSEDALSVAIETGSPLPEVHAEVIRSAGRKERRHAVERIIPKLPKETLNLANLTVEIRHQVITFLDEKKTGSPAKQNIALFEALMASAAALRNKGLLAEAADAASNAAHHASLVFRSEDPRDRQRLARAYSNIAVHLRDVARFEEALKLAEQAELIRHRLAEREPDKYAADWATSLGNLGNHLGEVGRFDEALKAAEQAELAWRRLAEKQPHAYTANWATSLNNLGNHFQRVGRFEEALKAGEQAELIRRQLAEKQPDTYTADWATSLANLGSRLAELGRFEEAWKVAEQAESLRRGLAEKQPDAYTADWATSLANLDIRLSELGRFEEALKVAEQAESLWRGLAEKQPEAYTAAWATSLGNLGSNLNTVGRFEEALKVTEKAEDLRRRLAEKQSDAYTGDWARSLANLGSSLSTVARFEEALKVTEKAENLRRRLAEKQPDACTADWATSLSNLGYHLGTVGRFEEALKVAEKGESLWRGLAEKQPSAYTADWASSLANLADSLVAAGQFGQALDAAKSALQHIAPFVERYPRVYRPWLGFAHRAAAEAFFTMGRFDEAADQARRSAEIWVEIGKDRQNYESTQIAKTFRILMKCEIALGRNGEVVAALTQAFLLLRRPLEVNPRPLRPLMLELTELAAPLDRNIVARSVPDELLAILQVER